MKDRVTVFVRLPNGDEAVEIGREQEITFSFGDPRLNQLAQSGRAVIGEDGSVIITLKEFSSHEAQLLHEIQRLPPDDPELVAALVKARLSQEQFAVLERRLDTFYFGKRPTSNASVQKALADAGFKFMYQLCGRSGANFWIARYRGGRKTREHVIAVVLGHHLQTDMWDRIEMMRNWLPT